MELSGQVLLVQIKPLVLFLDALGGSPSRPLTIGDLAAVLTKAGVFGLGGAAPVTSTSPGMRAWGGSPAPAGADFLPLEGHTGNGPHWWDLRAGLIPGSLT